MKRLVLIDGHAVLYRAFYALPKTLTTQAGKPVNAVYGFSRILFKVITEFSPTHLVVAFDLPKPTFRHKLFKGYQAKRPKMVDDLISQIKPIHELVRAFDIPIFEKEGFEADDVIGTLAQKANVDEIIIVTGDKDIFQLINKKVRVYALNRGISGGELVDEKKVEEILGIKPSQIVDYKALAGDPSDNYPGVTGIGPKTARKLLDEHGTLKQIIAKKLVKDKEAALLSQELAQIKKNMKLKFKLEESELNYDKEKVRVIFEKFRFKSLIKRLDREEQMRLL